jgi:hypothetical protein
LTVLEKPLSNIHYQGMPPGWLGHTGPPDRGLLTALAPGSVALHHALLSYVFGTGIVAITVSSVAALLDR